MAEITRKKLKICHIIHTLEVGGAEMLLFRVCSELQANFPNSYDFVVIASYASGPLQADFEKAGIRVISLRLSNKRFFSCVFRIFLALRRESPDIVHTHLLPPDKYGQTAAFLALVRRRVSTIHSMEPQPTPAEKKSIAVVRLLATKIIAVSRSVMENVVLRYGYDSNKIAVIHTAPSVSSDTVTPKRLTHPVSIVNLANIKEIKGHHHLIPAAVELKKVAPHFTLDIIGNSESALADSIRHSIVESGLSENVFLKGRIDNPVPLLSRYTCMISLSLYEGFPLAVIEGMSAGLPLILSDIPSHRELLEGIEGLTFVRPDSPHDIATAFSRLISDPEYYSRLSEKMIERSREFSISKMVEKYHAFYHSL